jgi:hypothetical protein
MPKATVALQVDALTVRVTDTQFQSGVALASELSDTLNRHNSFTTHSGLRPKQSVYDVRHLHSASVVRPLLAVSNGNERVPLRWAHVVPRSGRVHAPVLWLAPPAPPPCITVWSSARARGQAPDAWWHYAIGCTIVDLRGALAEAKRHRWLEREVLDRYIALYIRTLAASSTLELPLLTKVSCGV